MLLVVALLSFGLLGVLILATTQLRSQSKTKFHSRKSTLIGIFHPHCDQGGGGERVLWMMIAAILNNNDIANTLQIVIYCADKDKSKDMVIQNVMKKFRISISSNQLARLSIVYVPYCHLLEGSRYPYFTMLFQFAASTLVGATSLWEAMPDVFVDTTGAPFMYPLAKLCGCRVMAYVHYPIISSDMLNRVREMRPSYNNDERIANSTSVSIIKLLYYQILAALFSVTGYFVDMAFVNSSWTENHMKYMWRGAIQCSIGKGWLPWVRMGPGPLIKLYPPCNTSHLKNIPLGETALPSFNCDSSRSHHRLPLILSVGQFRPEKDHFLQISAFKMFLDRDIDKRFAGTRLVLLGSSRHADDEKLLAQLRKHAASIGVSENVDFVVNAPFDKLEEYLSAASIGLHTMWNEHFGISVVEMMAAGLLVIAHNSGGPAMDIVQTFSGLETGFLACSEEEYAQKMELAMDVLSDQTGKGYNIRENGRNSIDRFSDECFSAAVELHFSHFLGLDIQRVLVENAPSSNKK